MTARSIPRIACNAARRSLGASGGVYALPGAYGNLAAGPNTWQCASHAMGGNVNRGTLVSGSGALNVHVWEDRWPMHATRNAKDCRIGPRMPSTEPQDERALEA